MSRHQVPLASLILLMATLAVDCALLRRRLEGGYGRDGLEAGAVFAMLNILALGLHRALNRGKRQQCLIGFEAAGLVSVVATIAYLRGASDTSLNQLSHVLGRVSDVWDVPCRRLLPGLYAPVHSPRDEIIGYVLTPAFLAFQFSPFTFAQLVVALAGGLLMPGPRRQGAIPDAGARRDLRRDEATVIPPSSWPAGLAR